MEKKDKKIFLVQFINAVNLGVSIGPVFGTQPKHQVTLEKTSNGIWIKKEGQKDRWVPDANIKWVEFE